MNTDICYIVFCVEYPKCHFTNPIWYKKEKQQIQNSPIKSKKSIKTNF